MGVIFTENRCVCCGEIIPEGRLVCPKCENNTENNTDPYPDKKESHACIARVTSDQDPDQLKIRMCSR